MGWGDVKKKVKKELGKFGDKVENEAKRFGDKVEREGERVVDRLVGAVAEKVNEQNINNNVNQLPPGSENHPPQGTSESSNNSHREVICPEGFTQLSSEKCLRIIEDRKSWFDAEIACSNRFEGHLVTITSAKDNEIIINEFILPQRERLKGISNSLWIGLNNIPNGDGPYEWFATGEDTIDFVNWMDHEPNRRGHDHCALMAHDHQGRWNDASCTDGHPSICEYKGAEELIDTPILAIEPKYKKLEAVYKNPCPKGFQLWMGECYWINQQEQSFFEADQSCHNQGGHLVSIHSAQQNRWLAELIIHSGLANSHIWIGLNDISNDKELVWTDQTPHDYKSFWVGEPSGGKEHCVGYLADRSGYWNDYECQAKFKSICRWSPHQISIAEQITCPTGYISWYGYCYLFVTLPLNFFEADKSCQNQGGHLVSVHSAQQNRWLTELVRHVGLANSHIWIGLNDISNDKELVWTDQTPLDFRGFLAGEPSGGKEHCVGYFADKNGQWNDYECNAGFASICQWSTAQISMPEMLNCPTGYVSWYGYCYSIVTTLLNFFEAHDNCNAIGGELAAIESVEQNRWLFELLRTKGLAGRDVYIGLHDIDQEGAFQWLDHEIASRDFDFDHPHQPDNLDNSEHCVGFWSNFPFPKWNDMNCDSRAASICRWRPNRKIVFPANPCPEGFVWWSLTQKCYFIDTKMKLNYFDASKYCAQHAHGYLTSIHSQSENRRLYELLRVKGLREKDVWIGANDISVEKRFEWMDGTPFTYSNFASSAGQPDNYRGREHCVRFQFKDDTWNDVACSIPAHFICEWHETLSAPSPVVPIITADQSEDSCPPNFTFWNNHCYYLESDMVSTFQQANEACSKLIPIVPEGQQFRSHLVRITSSSVNRWLYELVSMKDEITPHIKFWWIGLRDIHGKFQWTSTIGSEKYSKVYWNKFVPQKRANPRDSNCTIYSSESHNEDWVHASCGMTAHYICEATRVQQLSAEAQLTNTMVDVTADHCESEEDMASLVGSQFVDSSVGTVFNNEQVDGSLIQSNIDNLEPSSSLEISVALFIGMIIGGILWYFWKRFTHNTTTGIVAIADRATVHAVNADIVQEQQLNGPNRLPLNVEGNQNAVIHNETLGITTASTTEEETRHDVPENLPVEPETILRIKRSQVPQKTFFIFDRLCEEFRRKQNSVTLKPESLKELFQIEIMKNNLIREKLIYGFLCYKMEAYSDPDLVDLVDPDVKSQYEDDLLILLMFLYRSKKGLINDNQYQDNCELLKKNNTLQESVFKEFFIPYHLIQEVEDVHGDGVYGKIKKGKLQSSGSVISVDVALKIHACDICNSRTNNWKRELLHSVRVSGSSRIVQCYGYTQHRSFACHCGRAFSCLIFELSPFYDFSAVLFQKKFVLDGKKLDWIIDMLQGIVEKDQNRVIHRDLKPANVLIFHEDNDVMLKIADFDYARNWDAHSDGRGGNLRYLAPEREPMNGKAGPTSDVFSWALIAIEVLTHPQDIDPSDYKKSISDERRKELQQLVAKELSILTANLNEEDKRPQQVVALLESCLKFNQVDIENFGRPTSSSVLQELRAIVDVTSRDSNLKTDVINRIVNDLQHLKYA